MNTPTLTFDPSLLTSREAAVQFANICLAD